MKAADFRQMGEAELTAKVTSMEEELFRLGCNKTLGQLEDTSVIKKTRRDIARAKTIAAEKRTAQQEA